MPFGAWPLCRRGLSAVIALFIGLACFIPQAMAQEFSFRWAFGAVQGAAPGSKLVPVEEDSQLATGDRLKMMVELRQPCFVYVFYRGPQGDLHQLFPYEPTDRGYRVKQPYLIPQGNLWFELDEHTGRETFYLMGADRRLEQLETIYGRYKATADPASAGKLADEVIAEIARLKESHTPLTAAAERPITLGGSIRGVAPGTESLQPDIASLAEMITARGFFLRTYHIAHR
jgi:hypothetical protein